MESILKKHICKITAVAILFCISVLCTACGTQPKQSSVDLQEIYEQFLEEGSVPEMSLLSSERVKKLYGIDTSVCPQAIFATCNDGLRIDEIWLVEAETQDAAEEIETIARGRVNQLLHETENYLPDQYAVAKQAEVLRNGKTVALLISPDATKLAALFEKA